MKDEQRRERRDESEEQRDENAAPAFPAMTRMKDLRGQTGTPVKGTMAFRVRSAWIFSGGGSIGETKFSEKKNQGEGDEPPPDALLVLGVFPGKFDGGDARFRAVGGMTGKREEIIRCVPGVRSDSSDLTLTA